MGRWIRNAKGVGNFLQVWSAVTWHRFLFGTLRRTRHKESDAKSSHSKGASADMEKDARPLGAGPLLVTR
jgi:hypothetical protein